MDDKNKFYWIFISLQFSLLGAIASDIIGIHIPLIRQLVGFLYLVITPGYLILKLIKLNRIDSLETILYSIGLSISTLMFTGYIINRLYPHFGISNPLSLNSLILTIVGINIIFIYLNYRIDTKFPDLQKCILRRPNPKVLLLLLLPVLSILGSHMVTYYQNDIFLQILIPIVALIPILVYHDTFSENLYPLLIFIVSISLLYHTSLISNYIWGWDINVEYNICNIVITNGYWNSSISTNVNSMLSIVMLAPILSSVLDLDLTWVFKIIYPLLFSLVPLALYKVYSQQTNSRIAIFSCFYFIFFAFFYFNAPTGGRQEIAELFLALLIMVIMNPEMQSIKKSILTIIFMFSLIVSHYGTAYIYMFLLIGSWIILKATELQSGTKNKTITRNSVLIFITFALSWYIYTSSSSAFISLIDIENILISRLFEDLFDPNASHGLKIISGKYALMSTLELYIQLLFQFFILVGIVNFMKKRTGKSQYNNAYIAFCILCFLLDFAGIVVPHFSSQLNAPRLYHLTLIFLSPISIVGGIRFFEYFSGMNKIFSYKFLTPLKLMSILLTIFLLFNTTWIYSLSNEYPESIRSIALHQEQINQGTDKSKNEFYAEYFLDQDVFSVRWIAKKHNENMKIYTDDARRKLIFKSYGMMDNAYVMTNKTVLNDSYLYLGYPNIKFNLMYGPKLNSYWHLSDINKILSNQNVIYNNGGAIVLR